MSHEVSQEVSLPHERTSQFLDGSKQERRQIITPEGVPLSVELANHGERLTAFLIDLTFWLLATLVIMLPLVLVGRSSSLSLVAISIGLFIAFIVRNIYFIYFEIAWRGATPGKRILGLRVIDRKGGQLQPAAVIARNLTREVECFIPFGTLMIWMLGGGSTSSGVDWQNLFITVWLLLFTALPFFNKDRMRGGDLIAGTILIALPKRALLGDLVEKTAKYTFTEQQLRTYGNFELQVLEELLRRPDAANAANAQYVLGEVCEKICRKIGWPTPVPPEETMLFLREFYTAERAFLEREQLYGKARADKFSQAKPPGDPKRD
jgi:uncharacterized RDD family membrane protein YckC